MATKQAIKRVCIYCGSSLGASDLYPQTARQLAHALVQFNYELVYGGARVGTMGVLADAMLEQGGRVIGVIPDSLVQKEVAHSGLHELYITASMHERKTRMEALSDAFIALPGGLGTLEELFEIWTWGQLQFHQKPFGLLNTQGYYQSLLDFLDHATAQQFIKPTQRQMLYVEEEPEKLLAALAGHTPVIEEKWY